MTTIHISGYSDDTVCVEELAGTRGARGSLTDEWSAYGDAGRFVVLAPSGDVFRVSYSEDRPGVWTVAHHTSTGMLTVRIERAPDGEDPEPYTDTAIVSGQIDGVECFASWPPTAEELFDAIEASIEKGRRAMTAEQTLALYRVLFPGSAVRKVSK